MARLTPERHGAQVRDAMDPTAERAESLIASRHRIRATIPAGVDLAAAWALRGLVLAAAVFVVAEVLMRLAVVALPVVIALLLSAFLTPAVQLLTRLHLSRWLAAMVVLLGASSATLLLLIVAGRQVASEGSDLAAEVVAGLEEVRVWLMTGPLQASNTQIADAVQAAQEVVTSPDARLLHGATEVTATVGRLVAGGFIVLFTTYFFLADGVRIWAWLVRLFPRAARDRVSSSGHVAWQSLRAFVRATIVVALADAVGVLIVAAVLGLPFLFAIGVAVFVGAFVPIVGALFSGMVAVMVALVDQGPWVALVMLGGVVLVQQLEAHVLQPFVLGRLVSVHPLGVVLAIATGVVLAGVAGALVAVPLVAAGNAVVVHLASSGP